MVFDANYYYSTYPDVAAAFGNDEAALFNHFVTYGVKEGRSGNAEFNPQAYRQRYADLQAAFGGNMAAYCQHYVTYGKAEGRSGQAQEAPAAQPPVADTPSGQQIGTYTTYYDAAIPRAINVELSSQRINGVVLQPGQSFSFSQAILPRTSENGYVMAPVIVGKTSIPGMGGGVCQVTSTLYAAMVAAGLPATEYYPHSRAVGYIPRGLDATIWGSKKDLRFDNVYSQPLMIQSSAVDGTLTVSLVLITNEQ